MNKINVLLNKLHKKYIAYTRAMVIGIVSGAYLFFIVIAPKTEASEVPVIETPTVTPTATPTPRPCDRVIDKIRCIGEDLGYDNKVIMTMIRIARAESNFRPNAKNGSSTASGVFQIIYGTWNGNNCKGSAFDAEDNIRCAYKLYASRGFQPWYASSSKWL